MLETKISTSKKVKKSHKSPSQYENFSRPGLQSPAALEIQGFKI